MSDDVVRVAAPQLSPAVYDNVWDVLNSGQLTRGEYVDAFESKWAEYVGVDHAVAVSNGTCALHLALLAAGIGEGDAVGVPAVSFGATAEAVYHADAIPVFLDVEADTYCLDPVAFADRARDLDAVIPVHLYGHPAEMHAITQHAAANDVIVIEDAAQAHGAEIDGAKAGSLGDAAAFSFYATKNITAAEGGIVTTDDAGIADRVRRLRNHGMTDRDTHAHLGFNYRLSDVHAAIGAAQVEELDELNRVRAVNTDRVLAAAAECDWLRPQRPREHVEHAWFWAPVEVDAALDGKKVRRDLLDAGVETRHRYTTVLQEQPAFRARVHVDDGTPVARRVAGQVLGLPNHPGLSSSALDRVSRALSALEY